MKTLQFKAKLLSDVILNQKSASESNNNTLDFIPGSCFLGIAASKLYNELNAEETHTLFHSGKVRWGDAHLAHNNNRTCKVPASMFYPKLKKATEALYIHHLISNDNLKSYKPLQLKQCRAGYLDFCIENPVQVKANTIFAIKSARDHEKRMSQDAQMFGYESLCKGAEMYFEIEIEDDSLETIIINTLEGKKRVGRSRTAQYGLIEIKHLEFKQIASNSGSGTVTVYADSRLVFFDEYGMPTFRPSPEQLGVTGGTINWEKSQVRTFQYAPWNFKRQCFDTDRCCIEKGSVFVIDEANTCPNTTKYVGCYNNEGLGRVIYNPCFLNGEAETGATVPFAEDTITKEIPRTSLSTPLLNYLTKQKEINERDSKIYVEVQSFDKSIYGNITPSQWGEIRKLASNHRNGNISDVLFKESTGYLKHGVAKEKWNKRGRIRQLESFVNIFSDEPTKRLALINLAAEMAKWTQNK